jgi:enoyl-CoA hydratase/carnithine racemase
VAIRVTKGNVHRAYRPDPDALQGEIDGSTTCYATEDFREGVAAFWARRRPEFQGR